MSAHRPSPLLVMIPLPRRTDMLAASQLFLVFIVAPSWSLSDHGRTNARPASVPKSRLCPSAFGGHAVDFRRGMPPLPFIGWAHLHLYFRRGSRTFQCRVVGTIRPVLWGLNLGVEGRSSRNQCICVKGSRSEFLYTRILWFRLPLFLRNLRMTQEDKFQSISKEVFSYEKR